VTRSAEAIADTDDYIAGGLDSDELVVRAPARYGLE
jgi:Antitoxin VbhA